MGSQAHQVLALAGLFQSIQAVNDLAWKGQRNLTQIDTALNSLLHIDAPDVESIYGGSDNLAQGLQILSLSFEGASQPELKDIVRYAFMVITLENKLSKNSEMLQKIGDGLAVFKDQMVHYNYALNDPNSIAKLAEIYSTTVSQLSPKIMIKGDPLHLQNSQNVNLIRALLLAAIRSAILWRQVGGSRLGLLFKRNKLLRIAKDIS